MSVRFSRAVFIIDYRKTHWKQRTDLSRFYFANRPNRIFVTVMKGKSCNMQPGLWSVSDGRNCPVLTSSPLLPLDISHLQIFTSKHQEYFDTWSKFPRYLLGLAEVALITGVSYKRFNRIEEGQNRQNTHCEAHVIFYHANPLQRNIHREDHNDVHEGDWHCLRPRKST